MTDLHEDTLAPGVVVRRSPDTTVEIRHGEDGTPPLVGLTHGALWARAEPDGAGVDLGHGSLNVVVRGGTVLLDAQGGAGLLIVIRGEVEISARGEAVRTARAGEAIGFDVSGTVGDSSPVDAAELAHDPFISLNLVLDSLAGVPVTLGGPDASELVASAPQGMDRPRAEVPDPSPSERRSRRFGRKR